VAADTLSALVVGFLLIPAACEWVIPAGRMLHPDELVRRCTNLAGVTTATTRPQEAAAWGISVGLAVAMVMWLLDRHGRSQRRSTSG
jgi:hypothetical protein